MGDIVNLRRVKKQREREAERAAAADNRARHGRTAAEKASDAARIERATTRLDQAKLDGDEDRG